MGDPPSRWSLCEMISQPGNTRSSTGITSTPLLDARERRRMGPVAVDGASRVGPNRIPSHHRLPPHHRQHTMKSITENLQVRR
jgi:hypothetical protein